MRHILILTIFMVPHAALAQDYIRCIDANKLCKGYELQISATNNFCEASYGICGTAPSICSQTKYMCESAKESLQAVKKMCDAARARGRKGGRPSKFK